jgi:starch phosphorylase
VKLYAEAVGDAAAELYPMTRARPAGGAGGAWVYSAAVPGRRPQSDYTARLIPYLEGVAIPLEACHILWQR